jgi:hypothetical protein
MNQSIAMYSKNLALHADILAITFSQQFHNLNQSKM